jgi:hypothetical protein
MPDDSNLKSEILEIMKELQPVTIKPDDNNSKNKIFEIMKDLQPVAFLISICLVIATFYVNNHDKVAGINSTNILMASIFFFFAYIGLFFFRKTNFLLSFYLGELSLVFGAIFIYASFSGIVGIICNAAKGKAYIFSDPNSLFIFVFLLSFPLISIMYLSGKVKKGKLYNMCKIFFHLSLILFCSCIVLSLFGILSRIQTSILTSIISIVIMALRCFVWISSQKPMRVN